MAAVSRPPWVEPTARCKKTLFGPETEATALAPSEKDASSHIKRSIPYAEVIASSPGLQCEASYPGVKVPPPFLH